MFEMIERFYLFPWEVFFAIGRISTPTPLLLSGLATIKLFFAANLHSSKLVVNILKPFPDFWDPFAEHLHGDVFQGVASHGQLRSE